MPSRAEARRHRLFSRGGARPLHPPLEDVHGADEVRHEAIGRPEVQLPGLPDLQDPSAIHHRDGVRDGQGLLLVVGHVNRRDLQRPLDGPDEGADLHPELRVQVGEGLVHQEQARLDHQCPGQDHSLLLPARELARHPPQQLVELYQPARLGHLAGDLVGCNAARLQAVRDVLGYRQVREDGVALKHDPDVAKIGRDVVHPVLVEENAPGVLLQQPRNDAEEGRLAAAARPDQGEELSRPDLQADVVDGPGLSKPLDDLLDADASHEPLSLWWKEGSEANDSPRFLAGRTVGRSDHCVLMSTSWNCFRI